MVFDYKWKSMEIRTSEILCFNGYNVHMQSVPITTNVVRLNPADGEMYSIQHYVINFVSDLRQIGCFFPDTPVSSTNNTDCHDIADILLKVAFSTTNHNPIAFSFIVGNVRHEYECCVPICRMSYLK